MPVRFACAGTGQLFGAEQVILVATDARKAEVQKRVNTRALALTVYECKGLEFMVSGRRLRLRFAYDVVS